MVARNFFTNCFFFLFFSLLPFTFATLSVLNRFCRRLSDEAKTYVTKDSAPYKRFERFTTPSPTVRVFLKSFSFLFFFSSSHLMAPHLSRPHMILAPHVQRRCFLHSSFVCAYVYVSRTAHHLTLESLSPSLLHSLSPLYGLLYMPPSPHAHRRLRTPTGC